MDPNFLEYNSCPDQHFDNSDPDHTETHNLANGQENYFFSQKQNYYHMNLNYPMILIRYLSMKMSQYVFFLIYLISQSNEVRVNRDFRFFYERNIRFLDIGASLLSIGTRCLSFLHWNHAIFY